ncbi:very short patch repair endonuclease [Undibacterium sp. Rencai35W]|uniref:very short patch repair endonuclease n=1 Tax=Undibacterium sp. Rencai35W TaxID=3413046 RepID=UPI003BF29681
MDTIGPEQRSRVMAAIKSCNTKPELAVRRMLHALGFRFRLHRKDLPGRPDIVLPKYKTVVLVNGCFWHQHAGCKLASRPASHQEYWEPKLDRNIERDKANCAKLTALGWRVVMIWECELRDASDVSLRLMNCLKHPSDSVDESYFG